MGLARLRYGLLRIDIPSLGVESGRADCLLKLRLLGLGKRLQQEKRYQSQKVPDRRKTHRTGTVVEPTPSGRTFSLRPVEQCRPILQERRDKSQLLLRALIVIRHDQHVFAFFAPPEPNAAHKNESV